MIGIIAAMNVEMESLRSYIQNPVTETISGITFVSGTLDGSEVVTAVCGIGKVFAAMCAQTMILRYKPDCIVNTGVAGTLTDKLEIGSIAVSSAVVQHDMDTSALGDPVGMISGINKVLIPAGQDLASAEWPRDRSGHPHADRRYRFRRPVHLLFRAEERHRQDLRRHRLRNGGCFHRSGLLRQPRAILRPARHFRQCGRFFPHGLSDLRGHGCRAERQAAAHVPEKLIFFALSPLRRCLAEGFSFSAFFPQVFSRHCPRKGL